MQEINTEKIWEEIDKFIKITSQKFRVNGIFICGSFLREDYDEYSDIDIAFLSKDIKFQMDLINFGNLLFDRLIASPDFLEEVLQSSDAISDILSYSFGSCAKIIKESPSITRIMSICRSNITRRNIGYNKPKERRKKIVDGIPFLIDKVEGRYRLSKNNIIIL